MYYVPDIVTSLCQRPCKDDENRHREQHDGDFERREHFQNGQEAAKHGRLGRFWKTERRSRRIFRIGINDRRHDAPSLYFTL